MQYSKANWDTAQPEQHDQEQWNDFAGKWLSMGNVSRIVSTSALTLSYILHIAKIAELNTYTSHIGKMATLCGVRLQMHRICQQKLKSSVYWPRTRQSLSAMRASIM